MKKIKLLVKSIVNGSIGTQVAAGVVAVTVLGGVAFGGYATYKHFNESKQERLNANVNSLKNKITELKKKASILPSNDEVDKLVSELHDLEIFDIESNYDSAYDRYTSCKDKYDKLMKSFKKEMEELSKELESLDTSKLDEPKLEEFNTAKQNYNTVCNMSDFRGYKSYYEQAIGIYNSLIADTGATEEGSENSSNENGDPSVENGNENSNSGSTGNSNSGSTGNSSSGSTGSVNTNSGSSKPNSGKPNSSSPNSGSSNSGSSNSGSSSDSKPSNPSGGSSTGGSNNGQDSGNNNVAYDVYNGFNYSGGYQGGFIGTDDDFVSRFSQLSSKSTVTGILSDVGKAANALSQGAYDDKVKAVFNNKLYDGKYLVTSVTIERFKLPILVNGELIVDPYSELCKQGVDNVPGGLFATVLGNYAMVSDSENDYFVKVTVQFKEI